jgi:hypothetical protein
MSGIYNPANPANTANNELFTGELSEFGMPVFSDPNAQATFKNVEDAYKKMLTLKDAYDKQELLRRMRTDMKREYLTRKNQVAQLQRNAAVEFRNAEFSLQEHYATQAADGGDSHQYHHGVRAVDISDPLVSQIHLPIGETLDLKQFKADLEFGKLKQMHINIQQQQLEQLEQEQEEESRAWFDQTPPTCDDECVPERRRRSAFGGCYDFTEEELLQQKQEDDDDTLSTDNKWNLPMTASQKQILEHGEKSQRDLDEYPNCYWTRIATRAAIDEANMLLTALKDSEIVSAMTVEERCASNYREIDHNEFPESQQQEEEEEEEEEEMELLDDDDDECLPIPDEPAATGSGAIAVGKSKKHQVKTIIKSQQQKRKQPKKKFVPLQITLNPNHEAANKLADAVIVNLSKRSIRTHGKKREAEKWNRINGEHKQSAARGTRITNILHEDSD